LKREGGTVPGFEAADSHPVEAEVATLEPFADVSLSNRRRLLEVTTAVGALVQTWMHGRVPVTFGLALAAVADFHRKHGFEIGGGTPDTLRGRLPLVMEEIGEVARWMTRGEGDLAEEHADLLILILGNAVAMGLDLEDAFVAKIRKIQSRTSRTIHGHKRVSHWTGSDDQDVTTRLDRYRLREPTRTEFKEPLPSPQLGFSFDNDDEQH